MAGASGRQTTSNRSGTDQRLWLNVELGLRTLKGEPRQNWSTDP